LLPRHVRATLKWPNDVLVNDGKIAGILVEQAGDALIVGIGLDVLQAPSGVSYKVSTIVGSGGLATVDGARERLLAAVANWFDIWQQDGFAPIRIAWLARAHPIGSTLTVRLGSCSSAANSPGSARRRTAARTRGRPKRASWRAMSEAEDHCHARQVAVRSKKHPSLPMR
jgi:hypothetical protein